MKRLSAESFSLVKEITKTGEAVLSQNFVQQYKDFVQSMEKRKTDLPKLPQRKPKYKRENIIALSNVPRKVINALVQAEIPEVYVQCSIIPYGSHVLAENPQPLIGKSKNIIKSIRGSHIFKNRKSLKAEHHLKEDKDIFARILKVNKKELFFNLGGTEAANLALIGCALANHRSDMVYIVEKEVQLVFIPFSTL